MTARSGPARRGGKRRARIAPQAAEALKKAHGLKTSGDYGAAASAFADLASAAAGRGDDVVACHLAYQSAKCSFRDGDSDGAMTRLDTAITHAMSVQNRTKFARKFGRLARVLRDLGHTSEADQVVTLVKERMGLSKLPKQGDPPPVNRAMRRALPKSCPSCGARVETAEIFFNEDSSADCRTCGSVLTG